MKYLKLIELIFTNNFRHFRHFRHFQYFSCLLLISGLIILVVSPASSAQDPEASCEAKMEEIFKAVKERTRELDTREEMLRIEEERINDLKIEIDNRIAELIKTREKMEGVLQIIRSEEKQNMKGLAKMYESMSPEDAASRIEKLNEELAVILLNTIKSKAAGKILAFIDSEKAVKLTQELGRKLIPEKE